MKKLLYILLSVPFALFGQDNYSLSFDGIDDYLNSNESLYLESYSFSASIYLDNIEIPPSQYYPIFFLGSEDENSIEILVQSNVNELENKFTVGHNRNINSSYNYFPSLTDYFNSWMFLTVTFENGIIKAYYNGIQQIAISGDSSHDLPNYSENHNISLGKVNADWGQLFLNGNLDDISIWDRALSQQEINDYMICPPLGNEEGLLCYWNCDEGSGDTAYDISGNGNDGTVYGATFSEDVPEQNCDELIEIEDFAYLGSFDGSNYYLSHNANYWEDAHQNCLFLGGDLLTISSIAENNFILESINSSNLNVDDTGFWIGLILINNEWGWISNEILSFVNWDENEPTNPPQNYGQLYTELSSNNDIPGSWDDTGQGLKRYILEIPITTACMNPDAINFDETATIDDEESCIYSQEYVHGLWNQVDDGAIEFSDYQEQATTSLSSLQQAIDTWNTTIDLSAGWNMFGYGCPSSIDVAEALSNHTESIIITKDNNGNVYMPEFGFNGIGDFTPGFGYQIKLTEAIEGFSLCDWYVNDIPEDNIVSLQEENASLQEEVDFMSPYFGCIDETACNYDETILISDGSCEFPEQGYDCEGNLLPIYQVGDLAEGGIVFYVDETGQHGLVAAMEDLTEGATDPYGWGFNGYEWGCYMEYVDGADGTSIGTGYENTMDIVTQGCLTQNGGITAAQAALDANINGYSDWYLPSKGELQEMLNTIGYSSVRWSSSESTNIRAFVVFPSGVEEGTYKEDTYAVRVIRSF